MLQNVVATLESQSGPGGLHENTLLLVMGDHGQTLNGDHGGGTAEEVMSLFSLSMDMSYVFAANCSVLKPVDLLCRWKHQFSH